jgi:hypothetical protein
MARRIALPLCEPRVIHDNDTQHRSEHVFDIRLETFAVDWTVKDAGCVDAFAAQRRHEGHGFPMAMRNLGVKPLAAPAPSPERKHVGLRPGLIDEDETFGVEPPLILLPPCPEAGDVRTLLLAGRDAFF